MKIQSVFAMAAAVAILAIVGFMSAPVTAQDSGGPKNLFAQYYTQPGASQSHAGMYPAPHPVPRKVGHTYYTYQPLMPHEMLYTHSRNYYNYHAGPEAFYCQGCSGNGGGSGLTKTTVKWQNGNSHMGPLPSSLVPLQHLHYKWAQKRYSVNSPSGLLNGGGFNLHSGGLIRDRIGSGGCASGNCGGGGAIFEGAGFDAGGFGAEGFDAGAGFSGCSGGCASTDNSWAEQAAAATARLSDGRVQR